MFRIVDRFYDSHVISWHDAARLGMIERRNARLLEEHARNAGAARRRRAADCVAAIMGRAA